MCVIFRQISKEKINRKNFIKSVKYSEQRGVVHNPMPLHIQEAFEYFGYNFPVSQLISSEIMSLAMNPYLNDDEIKYITVEALSAK